MKKSILIVWTFVMIGMVVSLTLFGYNIKNRKGNYILENTLITLSKKYYKKYPNLLPLKNNSVKLDVNELKRKGFNPMLNKDCDGYIIVKNDNNNYFYNSYVKCKDYVTKGYKN
jgi:hypothetical protein